MGFVNLDNEKVENEFSQYRDNSRRRKSISEYGKTLALKEWSKTHKDITPYFAAGCHFQGHRLSDGKLRFMRCVSTTIKPVGIHSVKLPFETILTADKYEDEFDLIFVSEINTRRQRDESWLSSAGKALVFKNFKPDPSGHLTKAILELNISDRVFPQTVECLLFIDEASRKYKNCEFSAMKSQAIKLLPSGTECRLIDKENRLYAIALPDGTTVVGYNPNRAWEEAFLWAEKNVGKQEKESVMTMTMNKTIPYFETWKTFSFQQMLEKARNRRSINLDHITSILSMSRINGDYDAFCLEPFTGNCSQGWIDFDSQVVPKFQDAYAWMAKIYRDPSNPPTPMECLIQFYRSCLKKNEDFMKTENFLKKNLPIPIQTPADFDLGRALRNWPSFKREDILIDSMRANGLNIETPSTGSNVHKHADIYFHHPRGKIIIWSYLSTSKGIENLVKKLLERGCLERGLNLLAPIDNQTDTEDYCGWWIPSKEYLDRLLQACENTPIDFNKLKENLKFSTKCLKDFILFN